MMAGYSAPFGNSLGCQSVNQSAKVIQIETRRKPEDLHRVLAFCRVEEEWHLARTTSASGHERDWRIIGRTYGTASSHRMRWLQVATSVDSLTMMKAHKKLAQSYPKTTKPCYSWKTLP
jgi:hypothetical protein